MIAANTADAVISSPSNFSSSKDLSTLNGTESWCWTSNSTEPYFRIDFKQYAVLCAFNFTLNGVFELTYGNKVSNKSKVSIYDVYVFFDHFTCTYKNTIDKIKS